MGHTLDVIFLFQTPPLTPSSSLTASCIPTCFSTTFWTTSVYPTPASSHTTLKLFFRTIRKVHEQTPLDVKTMSISQWARILTEDGLTMEQVPNQETRQYIPCSCELLSP